MKRIALLTIAVFIAGLAFGQKSNVNGALGYLQNGKLKEALEKIEPALEDESTKEWSKTWYVRGQVYQEIFRSPLPAYKELHENPLPIAYDSYIKALETGKDEKTLFGKQNPYKDDVMEKLRKDNEPCLKIDFLQAGIDAFNKNDFEKAYEAFKHSLKIDSVTDLAYTDTAIVFNAGIAADRSEHYRQAADYYMTAGELDYKGPELFVYAATALYNAKDSTAALQALKKGMEAYPSDNQVVMNAMINHYLNTGETEEAQKYLDQAIEQDPENHSYYFAKGTLFDKEEKYEKAIELYKKALEIEPGFFNALYNLGAIYFNFGVKVVQEAQDIPIDQKEAYDEKMNEAKKEFEDALPYLEKAHEVKPDDYGTMQTLKTLYTRLQMNDKAEEIKAKMEE